MSNNFEILRAGGDSEIKTMTSLRTKKASHSNKKNLSSEDFLEREKKDNGSNENLSNLSQTKEPIEDPSGMTEYFDTKVNLMISTVQEFFPDLSSEFAMKCLQYYRYSVEEVLNALFDGNLPPSLVGDCGIEEPNEMSSVSVSDSTKNCSSQLEKAPAIYENTNEPDIKEAYSLPFEEIEATVSGIEEIYPELGRGFIKECLKYCNYSGLEALDAITDDNLPPFLESMDRTAKEPLHDSMPTNTLGEESLKRSSSQMEKGKNQLNKRRRRKRGKKSKSFSEEESNVIDDVIKSNNDTKNLRVTGEEKPRKSMHSRYMKDVLKQYKNSEISTVKEE